MIIDLLWYAVSGILMQIHPLIYHLYLHKTLKRLSSSAGCNNGTFIVFLLPHTWSKDNRITVVTNVLFLFCSMGLFIIRLYCKGIKVLKANELYEDIKWDRYGVREAFGLLKGCHSIYIYIICTLQQTCIHARYFSTVYRLMSSASFYIYYMYCTITLIHIPCSMRIRVIISLEECYILSRPWKDVFIFVFGVLTMH